MSDANGKRSRIRTLLLLPLVPFVVVGSLIVLLPRSLFVAMWNAIVYGIYWARWKIYGEPIPPKGPPALRSS